MAVGSGEACGFGGLLVGGYWLLEKAKNQKLTTHNGAERP